MLASPISLRCWPVRWQASKLRRPFFTQLQIVELHEFCTALSLSGGIVDVLAASSMTTVFKLDAGSSTRPDAVGVATNPLMDGLWVLYSDRSLSFFSDSAAAAWTLPGAVCDLRAPTRCQATSSRELCPTRAGVYSFGQGPCMETCGLKSRPNRLLHRVAS